MIATGLLITVLLANGIKVSISYYSIELPQTFKNLLGVFAIIPVIVGAAYGYEEMKNK